MVDDKSINVPLLSISCITYNHVNYIRQALDGFLMQKTSFPFEIIIHDDASNDGTREIIEEYHKKFPELIFPYFQKENQYSKGIRGITMRYNYPRCRGKYIALCEGDDYWTDPNKLQKQVDFLEKNEDYIACFHNALIENEITNQVHKYHDWTDSREVSKIEVIEIGGYVFPTASLVFRNSIDYNWLLKHAYCSAGDLVLSIELIKKGNLYYLDDIMCNYRRHIGGVYSNLTVNKKKMIGFELEVIYFLEQIKSELTSNYLSIFENVIKTKYKKLFLNYDYSIVNILVRKKYLNFSDIREIFQKKFL